MSSLMLRLLFVAFVAAADNSVCTDCQDDQDAQALLQSRAVVDAMETDDGDDDTLTKVDCVFNMMEEDGHPGESGEGVEYGVCVDANGKDHYLLDDDDLEVLEDGAHVTLELTPSAPPRAHLTPFFKVESHTVKMSGAEMTAARREKYGVSQQHGHKEMDVLMIICEFTDAKVTYTTETKLMDEMYATPASSGTGSFPGSMSDMMEKSSYGRVTMPRSKGKVVTVKMSSLWASVKNPGCNTNAVRLEALKAVKPQHGIDPNTYTFREIYFPSTPNPGCRWAGMATVGCGHPDRLPNPAGCWAIYRSARQFVRAHELGHNLGMLHAGGDKHGTYVEYGDPEASMGASYRMSSFIAAARGQMGLLTTKQGEIIEYDPNKGHSMSTYKLGPISMPLNQPGADAVAIKFPCPDCVPRVGSHVRTVGGFLWVQFRGDEGYSAVKLDKKYQNKVYIHLARKFTNKHYGRGTEMWQMLGAGETFSHTVSGSAVQVKVDAIQGDLATISIVYPTTTTTTPPPPPPGLNVCGFEDAANPLCGFLHQDTTDDFDWTLKSGRTPSGSTGPNSAKSGGKYMYVEVSYPVRNNAAASLKGTTPVLSAGAYFNLAYHMDGDQNMGSLKVSVVQAGSPDDVIFSKTGTQGKDWKSSGNLALDKYAGRAIEIKISATKKNTWKGDIAIDDVQLFTGTAGGGGGGTQPPATQPPATQPPATQPPATQPPATQPPTTQAPPTQPPATQPPPTQPPATQPPATQPPATQPPATQPPATQPPSSGDPVKDALTKLSGDVKKGLQDLETKFKSTKTNFFTRLARTEGLVAQIQRKLANNGAGR